MNYYATYNDNNILTGFYATKPVTGNYVILSEELKTEILSMQFTGQIQFISVECGMIISRNNISIVDNTKIQIIDKNLIIGQQLMTLNQQVTAIGQMITQLMLEKTNDTK